MTYVDAELVLISIAAMLSPTTLSFSVLALVLGDRPLRTGWWFYLGALGATLVVGVAAAFLLGNAAASHSSSPKTWVAVFDIVAASLLIAYVARTRNRPLEPAKVDAMVARMSKVASSPAVGIIGAGAVLANPGAFIPLALKSISEENPTAAGYVAGWVVVRARVPAAARDRTRAARRRPRLGRAHAGPRVRDWLLANARMVASVIIFLLSVALLRNGISGLVG